MTDPVVHIQGDPANVPRTPPWFGEVTVVAHALQRSGMLGAIQERVRFVRARMGKYELIDGVAMLIGYAVSGEPTLRALCERVQPCAGECMALFGRADLPTPPTLSRSLAVLDQPCVEALRTLFLEDLVARAPFGTPPGGLWDRLGGQWLLMDVDGTTQAARQRALPATEDLPPAHRRFDRVCAPGHLGRKRGDVARTRTTILQAHTHQFVGTFGTPGNGQYRQELKRARTGIAASAHALSFPLSHVVIRLDGLDGDAAPLVDLLAVQAGEEEGPAVVVRGKAYHLLEQPALQQRLLLPPDQMTVHPESGARRALSDCGHVQRAPTGPVMRMLLATPPAGASRPPIGNVRDQTVSEPCFPTLPSSAFPPADVRDRSLHRGSFETVLADEDEEHATDRLSCRARRGDRNVGRSSASGSGTSAWRWGTMHRHARCVSRTWPLRECWSRPLPPPMTILRLLLPFPQVLPLPLLKPRGQRERFRLPRLWRQTKPRRGRTRWMGPRPPGQRDFARPSFTHGCAGSLFPLQPDGTRRCPAGHPLVVEERRPERNGSLRVLYTARIGHCRPCPLRAPCQESGSTKKPRRVSAVFWPRTAPLAVSSPAGATSVPEVDQPSPPADQAPASLPVPTQPVRWGDWSRCPLRRSFVQLLRTQTVLLSVRTTETLVHAPSPASSLETRAQRAHWRRSWQERFARNARPSTAPSVEIPLHGLPDRFIQACGFPLKRTA